MAAGISAGYYSGSTYYTDLVQTRTDPNVDLNLLKPATPAPGIDPNSAYSAKWEGLVTPSYTETYTFSIEFSKGGDLWVNGVQMAPILANSQSTYTMTAALTAGVPVTLQVEYYDDGSADPQVCILSWSSLSQASQIIPQSVLQTAPLLAAPTGLTGTVSGSTIVLDVTAPSSTGTFLDGYHWYRNSGDGEILIGSTSGATYTDATAVPGETYEYTAAGWNLSGDGGTMTIAAGLPAAGGSKMERSTVFQGCQVGIEATPGTLVPATKKLLACELNPIPEPMVTPYRPWGTKGYTAAVKGKEYTKCSLKGTLDYNEILYWLSALMTAPAAPTRPNASTVAYEWAFAVNPVTVSTPNSLTIEVGGAQGGSRFGFGTCTDMDLKFDSKECALSGTVIGQVLIDDFTMTSSLPEVAAVPVDPATVTVSFGTASGALTPLTQIIDAEIKIGNMYKEQMFLNSDGSFSGLTEEAPTISPKIMTVQNSDADNMLAHLRNGDLCYLGISAQGPLIDATTAPHTFYGFTLEIPVYVTKTNRGDHQGLWESEYDMVVAHDSTYGLMQATVTNKIAAL